MFGLRARLFVAASLVLTLGVACNDHNLNPFASTVKVAKVENTPLSSRRPVDILFVVDSSNSMCEEQSRLRDNFNTFINELTTAGADFQLAVVSTDVTDLNTFGQFRKGPGTYVKNAASCPPSELPDTSNCDGLALPANGILDQARYPGLQSEDPAAKEQAVAALQEEFACLALTGIDGNFVEMGLEGMRLGLSPQNPNAATFLRKDAFLALVFVSDENDCSDGTGGVNAGPVYTVIQGGGGDTACEYNRNTEDSCLFAAGEEGGTFDYEVLNANGEPEMQTKTAKGWCAHGDRNIVNDMAAQGRVTLGCEGGTCSSQLVARREYYDFVVNLVATRDGIPTDEARESIIAASIVNQDDGVRFNSNMDVPAFCGDAGTNGYRYELFTQMFAAEKQVVAPICDVTTQAPADFGTALGQIGESIGKALNSVCLADRPFACNVDTDCPAPNGQQQTCSQVVFPGTPSEFKLCSGFSVKVEVAQEGQAPVTYTQGVEYDLNVGVPSCVSAQPEGPQSGMQVSFKQPPPPGAAVTVSYARDITPVND